MTDKEIIKALECCTTEICWDCPFEPKEQRKGTIGCCEENIKNALDLINRQKAEIERLKKGYFEVEEAVIKTAKDEAVKDFAERLKAETIEVDVSYGYGREHYTEAVAVIVIDNLVKERVGEN